MQHEIIIEMTRFDFFHYISYPFRVCHGATPLQWFQNHDFMVFYGFDGFMVFYGYQWFISPLIKDFQTFMVTYGDHH